MKLSDISELTKDDVLAALGLATKPSTSERLLGSLGFFGLGAVVGAGLALMLAPSSGQELRGDLGKRIRRAVPEAVNDLSNGRSDLGRDTETRSST
jgi:gas vesicle protein